MAFLRLHRSRWSAGCHALFTALWCANPMGFSLQRNNGATNMCFSHFVGSTFQSFYLVMFFVLSYMSPAARMVVLHLSSIHEEMDTLKSACNPAELPPSKSPRKGENKFLLCQGFTYLALGTTWADWHLFQNSSWNRTWVTNLCEAMMDAEKFTPQPSPSALVFWSAEIHFLLNNPMFIRSLYFVKLLL